MKIYRNIEDPDIGRIKKPFITIGGFDGLHKGHLAILQRLTQLAHENNGESVVITFSPHPRLVLYKDDDFKLLTTDDEKIEIFEKLKIEHLLIYPFSKEFSETSSDSFIEDILVNKLHARELIIGYDHHFGSKRKGDIKKLTDYSSKFNFEIEEIPQQQLEVQSLKFKVQSIPVSSTNIRKELFKGNIRQANALLGYEYNITGKVIEGNKLGKQIGFPTANIEVNDKNKLIPPFGVYAVRIRLDTRYKTQDTRQNKSNELMKGMLYIGNRPTLPGAKFAIEVNIFNFNEDIYGKEITVYFADRIRDDKKFDNLEALKEQITKDKEEILKLLSEQDNTKD